jgi:hypothetical protein
MTMSSSSSVPGLAPGVSRDGLLRKLIEVATQAANPRIDGFTNGLIAALQRAAGQGNAELYLKAAELLKKNRYPFYYVVSACLERALEQELLPAAGADQADAGLPALAPDLEIDKARCLFDAGQAIEQEHAERLAALKLRMAVVLDVEQLDSARNPFRPQVFLSALHQAWREFHPDADAHHLLFRLLGPRLCLDLGPILHALNIALAKRGIALTPAAAPAVASTTPAADNDPLLQQLRRLFAPPAAPVADRPLSGEFPALFQDQVLQASTARDELLDRLSRMQDRLEALQPEDVGQGAPLAEADAAAIRLVTQIFALIRDNSHLPMQLKPPILSLHLPLLRVALTEPDFFLLQAHPARRTLELLVRLALGWERRVGDSDTLYPLLMHSIGRIAEESGRHTGIFAEVAAELEVWARREQTATEQALANPIAQAVKQEKRLQARRAAKHEVALRVGTGEVAAFVETFLEDKWVAVLTLAYVARDEKPQAVDGALRAMDELVWSVKPKITADERKELLSRLPPMIAMLNKWLDLVQWKDEGRVRFFTELARCHASLVRAPLEMSPQRQVELAIAAAQQAAERRELRRLAQQAEAAPDAFDDAVAALQSGAWIAFRQNGQHVTRLKLAWISPMRNLYLFATRDRKEALTLEAEQLARALREQRAQVVPAAGLVGHALADALGVDSANLGRRAAA